MSTNIFKYCRKCVIHASYAFHLIFLIHDICSVRGCTLLQCYSRWWPYIRGVFSNMSQWDPLPTKLTTFGHLSSEEQQSSGFLSRIFRKTRGKSSHFSFFFTSIDFIVISLANLQFHLKKKRIWLPYVHHLFLPVHRIWCF